MIRSRTLLLALVLTAACGAAQTGSEDRPRPTSRDLLTAEQVAATGLTSAYDVISRLQPGWLQSARGSTVAVFVNGSMVGDVEFLRELPASQVAEARYITYRNLQAELGAAKAYGLNGAIMIRTSRPGRS
jgi:hypothetical protein